MRNHKAFAVLLAVALMLVFGAVVALQPAGNVNAAPDGAPAFAPTPVSATDSGGNNDLATFWSSEALTATGTSSVQNVQNYERIDLQYVIDQGATPNTLTVKLQFSNDNTNWVDGATIVTDNAADANVMQQFAVFGRFARLHATAGNSESVTVTANGVLK